MEKKKALITILGTAGTKFNRDKSTYEAVDSKSKYRLSDCTDALLFHNTFPLLLDKYLSSEYDFYALSQIMQ